MVGVYPYRSDFAAQANLDECIGRLTGRGTRQDGLKAKSLGTPPTGICGKDIVPPPENYPVIGLQSFDRDWEGGKDMLLRKTKLCFK